MHRKPYIVGITGGSASGKTYVLQHIRSAFDTEDVCIISQDDYYRPLQEQERDQNDMVNFDLPSAINASRFAQDLSRLRKGETFSIQEYTFNNPDAEPEMKELYPAPLLVVEGLFIFTLPEIRELLNLKVFVDAHEEVMFQRRMHRDANERGIDVDVIRYQWEHHVAPAYREYLLPFREQADVILTNNKNVEKGLKVLLHHLDFVLEKG